MNNGTNSNKFQAVASNFTYPNRYFAPTQCNFFLFNLGKINTTTSALQDAINALIMLQLNSIKTHVKPYQPIQFFLYNTLMSILQSFLGIRGGFCFDRTNWIQQGADFNIVAICDE